MNPHAIKGACPAEDGGQYSFGGSGKRNGGLGNYSGSTAGRAKMKSLPYVRNVGNDTNFTNQGRALKRTIQPTGNDAKFTNEGEAKKRPIQHRSLSNENADTQSPTPSKKRKSRQYSNVAGILPNPDKDSSIKLQEDVRNLARKKEVPDEAIKVVLPDVESLFDNAASISAHDLTDDVITINDYHKRVLANPEMLDKLKNDWFSFQVDEELKKILDCDKNHKSEANRIIQSHERTQYIAKSIRLLKRCIEENLLNNVMKYYRNKKGIINDFENIRSLARGSSGTSSVLSSEDVMIGSNEDDEDVVVVNHLHDEEEAPDINILRCDGINKRKLKPHEIYLKGSDTVFDDTMHCLQCESHEMANCETQYGALLVELIQTAVARSYDLPGDHHCLNRSFFAPVFDHFDDPESEKNKASNHCSAIILVHTKPFLEGSVGINADYSLEFSANCFMKNAKRFRAAQRKSGTRFTHDARWLQFESLLDKCKREQNVTKGDHFIPNLDILASFTGFPKGTSGRSACDRWKYIATGERLKGHANIQHWQVESLKKHGIFLDDDVYMRCIQEDQKTRESNGTATTRINLKASLRKRWGKGNKKQKKN